MLRLAIEAGDEATPIISAAGAIEGIVTIMSIDRKVLTPTIN